MGTDFAILPMYDWPEVRGQTDRLWTAIARALHGAGIAAPSWLARNRRLPDAWLSPDLLLGQTCGLPYRRLLQGRVGLVGAPDYGIGGCPPGWYRSVLVARTDGDRQSLKDFRGMRLALNDDGSQSGLGALVSVIRRIGPAGPFFAEAVRTGAHRESIRAVAAGLADIASIDAVTWRLALAHEPAARVLTVIGRTPPTPGLPFITSQDRDTGTLAAAVAAGIAGLDRSARAALGLAGFARLTDDDYATIDPAVSADGLLAPPAVPVTAGCPLPA